MLPLKSTSCTVTGVYPPNTSFKGRAWPATSLTTSSLHSYEVTTQSPAASTDDLSQDGDSDPSAPCTTATRLASQIAPACENFTIGTRAIFPFPHQRRLGGQRGHVEKETTGVDPLIWRLCGSFFQGCQRPLVACCVSCVQLVAAI